MDFQEELRRFREKVGSQQVAGLIIPGSLQATTAALLIGALQPARVAFLLTPDTRGMSQKVAQLLATDATHWEQPPDDHSNILQMYGSLRKIIDAWSDLPREQIAVDVTGGTKLMSVGLAKAAYVLKITTLYIESEFAPDANGRNVPQPGTQGLVLPSDPYVVFGDLEEAEARRLYDAHDYDGAHRVFTELVGRVPLRHDYKLCAAMAHAYALWDAFNLAAAEAELHSIQQHPALNQAQQQCLAEQIDLITTVRPLVELPKHRSNMQQFATAQVRLLADPRVAGALLATLYSNALRRADQDRRDTAALLLYRCLELMSQQRLATHGVCTEWARDPMRRLTGQFPDLADLLRNPKAGWSKITLGQGYDILRVIGDAFGTRCDLSRIQQGAENRNQSLLAHGFAFISSGDYDDFKAVVDEVIAHWCAVQQVDWQASLQRATFMPLP
ncbi:TIGR02710 family CRISPR-associated CARF protein [Candidatus Viridilinea mediisalina]|uniref:TIGR02710 family CRISPR-associated protein n=1 Tax=Candidatus Viridilinea mediisalina TaxID=2024553 RepID=A0A2A6RNN6_9CHLR|nr:TIGR02710 family CRISPR-associated CARF protein [Candidatus Viridilinea mediisalina]PDW04672.1 TIGR02710 family CRISPR-associated protein [Candidatus Viridilinea mediisalina]